MLALALEHGLERSRRKIVRFGCGLLPGSTQCAGTRPRQQGLVVDFRADLSSYDVMIAAAGQQEVCHG